MCQLFSFMNEEKDLAEQGNDVGENCYAEEETLLWLPELPARGDQDWNSLRLVFFFLFLIVEEKEKGGATRRPQVTFWIISLMPGVDEWERKTEGEVKVWKKEQCVHFLSSLLGGSRQWIFRGLTLLHVALSLQSVWKLHPQRAEEMREEKRLAQC